MSSLIKEVQNNGVGKIILNRVDVHNAFDETLIDELTTTIQAFEDDDAIRFIVLTGNGNNFCAGADLQWMKRTSAFGWDENYQDSLKLASLMQTLYQCQKTTIAIVQGCTYGGGIGLVACCDIVLASQEATFCLSEVKLGLLPAVISPYVIAAIGQRNAKRYFASAEVFDAQEAKRLNLVHQLCQPEHLEADAEAYLIKLLQNGPTAVRLSKQLINDIAGKPIVEDLIRETAHKIADVRSSDEGKEGIAAFLEKRAPNWTE